MHSFRSELFHEKMIQNIAKTSFNKLAFRVSNENQSKEEKNNKLKASDLSLENDNLNQNELIEKLNKKINRNLIIK